MKKRWLLLLILLSYVILAAAGLPLGCAVVHRYPPYRGTTLELGTNKPIEGAGVIAVYKERTYWPPAGNTRYKGFQAVLTDSWGRFEIPAKFFFEFLPMVFFHSDPDFTIYKQGYGNFPGSFRFHDTVSPGVSTMPLEKEGISDPIIYLYKLPSGKKVTLWLPKLETEKEVEEHDRLFSVYTSEVVSDKGFPPGGTKKNQFLPPGY